ncbi:MAG: TolC family protein [Rikenellaceae bacterium]
MRERVLYILLPLLLLSVESGYSQRTLTLEECKDLAIESNHTLAERRLEVEMARQHHKELFTMYFPELSISGSYSATTSPMLTTDIETASLPLPEMGLPAVLSLGMLDGGAVASLTAQQTLYGGGMVRNANRLSSVGVEVSKLQYTLSADEVELKCEEYYMQCVKLSSKLQIVETAMEQLEELRRNVANYVEAGVANTNDLMRVEIELSKLEGDKLSASNGLLLSKLLLAQHIGLTADSFEIADTANFEVRDPQIYLVDFNRAVDSSTEVALLNKQIEANKLEVKIESGKRMPKVAVGGAYSYNNLLDKNNDFFVGMASVSIPITGWWSGSHKVKRAKMKEQQSITQYNDAAEQLHLQITHLYLSLTEHYQQCRLASRRVAQAEENLRIHREEYNAGHTQLVDLLDAQTLLQQCKDGETECIIEYRIALSHYLQRADI